MTLHTALAAGRRAKARRMTSTCTIGRPGADVTNPTTGVVTTPLTAVYAGPCYLPKDAVDSTSARLADVASVTAQRTALELPWDTTGVAKDDVVTVTGSTSPANAGRVMRVLSVAVDDDATALRISCEELT